MSGHTKGPWMHQAGTTTIYTLTNSTTNAVASALTIDLAHGSLIGREEATANARLIAAAPALLEALEKIAVESVVGGDSTGNPRWSVTYDLARTAIAAARGEEAES